MTFAQRTCAALALATSAMLLSAAKPAPTPSNFVPALAYRYNGQEIRLANATGSQAALLIRMPTSTGINNPIQDFAIASMEQGRVAFVDHSVPGVRGLRFVTWIQPTPGGPVSVSLAPTQFYSTTASNIYPNTLDFSPDGSKLALVEGDVDTGETVLRFFDGVTGAALGEPIPLAYNGHIVRWQADGQGVWLSGQANFASFRDGVETSLFVTTYGRAFDPYNVAASSIMLHNIVDGAGALQRWDGALLDGSPVVTTIVAAGAHISVSCDDARVVYRRGSPRAKALLYNLQTKTETTFSQDSGINYLTYPSTCG